MNKTTEAFKLEAPEGYALISIDALKAWGKYDEVSSACQFFVEQEPKCNPHPDAPHGSELSQNIINTAKVEIDYLKAGGKVTSEFIEVNQPKQLDAAGPQPVVRQNTMDKNVRKYIKLFAVVYLLTTVTLVSLGLITWMVR